MSAEAKIKELGLVLPPAPPPGGVYRPIVITGNLLFLSGHGPVLENGDMIRGKIGIDLNKGCSELFAEVWGEENGLGSRSAVGFGSLPGNISVEIEATFEINQ